MPKRHRQPNSLETLLADSTGHSLAPVNTFASAVTAHHPSDTSRGSFSSVGIAEQPFSRVEATKKNGMSGVESCSQDPAALSASVSEQAQRWRVRATQRLERDQGKDAEADVSSSLSDDCGAKECYAHDLRDETESKSLECDSWMGYGSSDVGDDGNQYDDDVGDLIDEEDEEVLRSGDYSGSEKGNLVDGHDDGSDFITVNFGVYDMEQRHVDAVMHLMDQLCPDKMNEIDRDALGAALAQSPYTSIVKVSDEDGNPLDKEGEEEEVYGLVSVLNVVDALYAYPAAFRPFCKLLKDEVWRVVSLGVPPTDVLLSTTEETCESGVASSKCLLLVNEFIRNVPLELTVEMLEDTLRRLDVARQGNAESGAVDSEIAQAIATDGGMVKRQQTVHPSVSRMFAVLAKVQRVKDAGGADRAEGNHNENLLARKKKGGGGDALTSQTLDINHYIFWREEDSVLFEHRDQRIATWAYRCRVQYKDQPEEEVPLSLLFVLQHSAILEAIEHLKKRAGSEAEVVRY